MDYFDNIEEIVFLSDTISTTYLIQGLANRYLKKKINFRNILYLIENSKDDIEKKVNTTILESKKLMMDMGINDFYIEDTLFISSIKGVEKLDLNITKLIVCIFDSTATCNSFLKDPEFFKTPLNQILKINLPFKQVSLINEEKSRIKALKYNRDILGIQIKGYELFLKNSLTLSKE